MNGFTPGPWFNAGSTNNIFPGFFIRSKHKAGYLAEVRAFTGQAEVEANARLIASAPDLLNALSVLADAAESRGIPVDAARAAIAKATGAHS